MYQTKIIDYKYKKKIVTYNFPIHTGGCNKGTRKNYKEMTEEERKVSDSRRIRYYNKVLAELTEIAMMNPFKVMLTLTFKEDIQMYKEAIERWKKFVRRLKWKYGEIVYFCVWERTKKNRIHFHVLIDLDIESEEVMRLWRYGYICVSPIHKGEKIKCIRYMTKYMFKSVKEKNQQGKCIRGERFFFCSKNLNKPEIQKIEERLSIPNVIFENMENVIEDGIYEMKDCNGKVINKAEFVEYKV